MVPDPSSSELPVQPSLVFSHHCSPLLSKSLACLRLPCAQTLEVVAAKDLSKTEGLQETLKRDMDKA